MMVVFPCPPGVGVAGYSWWRHEMETFSALLAICAGNSPVPGEFPTKKASDAELWCFLCLRPNKQLSKHSWGWWFETPSWPLWRHCNVIPIPLVISFPLQPALPGSTDDLSIAACQAGYSPRYNWWPSPPRLCGRVLTSVPLMISVPVQPTQLLGRVHQYRWSSSPYSLRAGYSPRYHWWFSRTACLTGYLGTIDDLLPVQPAWQGTHLVTIDDLPAACVAGNSPQYRWWPPSPCSLRGRVSSNWCRRHKSGWRTWNHRNSCRYTPVAGLGCNDT